MNQVDDGPVAGGSIPPMRPHDDYRPRPGAWYLLPLGVALLLAGAAFSIGGIYATITVDERAAVPFGGFFMVFGGVGVAGLSAMPLGRWWDARQEGEPDPEATTPT